MWQQIPFLYLVLFSEKEQFCGIFNSFYCKIGRLKNLNFNHTQTLAFEFNSLFTLTQFSFSCSFSFLYHSGEFSSYSLRHTVYVCVFFFYFCKSWNIKFYCHFGTTELNLGNEGGGGVFFEHFITFTFIFCLSLNWQFPFF